MKTLMDDNDGFLGTVILQPTHAGWIPTAEMEKDRNNALELAMGDFSLGVLLVDNHPWVIGDMLNFLYKLGVDDTVTSIVENLVGVDNATRKYLNYKWVASVFPIEARKYDLRWTHYRYAAGVDDPKARQKLLEIAERDNLNTADFQKLCKEHKEKTGQPEPQLNFVDDEDDEDKEFDSESFEEAPPPLEDYGDAKPFDTVSVTVTVTTGVHDKMQEIAGRKGLRVDDVVMVALSQYIKENE